MSQKHRVKNEEIWYQEISPELKTNVRKILGVFYVHLQLPGGDELYLTKYGLPFIENLRPENFLTDRKWFESHSRRLSGTSCIYKVQTKKVRNFQAELVIKWNRMGEDVPGGQDNEEFWHAEFNSPFEEFSLLMELRRVRQQVPGVLITQKPLAIYVPDEKIELWQLGRKKHKMQKKIDIHEDIQLDMFRRYLVIYKWIEGIDAVEAYNKKILSEDTMKNLTLQVESEMGRRGFLVKDRKPHHIIVKPNRFGSLVRDNHGDILHATIDFELLQRTESHESAMVKIKRQNYLIRQRDRFKDEPRRQLPPNLHHQQILGVDYIFGRCESTQGILWVVGKDPDLFDYFLPERWEAMPRTRLSLYNDIFKIESKDHIYLVWKVSRVGIMPDADPFKADESRVLEYGYNSPFEEVAIALDLTVHGINTVYPRAIYMSGHPAHVSDEIMDHRRYVSHQKWTTPGGKPLLRRDRHYYIIFGYFNGPDEMLANEDGHYYQSINAITAYHRKLLSLEQYMELMKYMNDQMAKASLEDLNLRGSHLILALDEKGELVRGKQGIPDARICNFELLCRIGSKGPLEQGYSAHHKFAHKQD
ncbi:MAG: hypothetical protein JXR70_07485 [Spirochaetales bacterium]|nr:hypothetical protein [Spirochaetales bacterium]